MKTHNRQRILIYQVCHSPNIKHSLAVQTKSTYKQTKIRMYISDYKPDPFEADINIIQGYWNKNKVF